MEMRKEAYDRFYIFQEKFKDDRKDIGPKWYLLYKWDMGLGNQETYFSGTFRTTLFLFLDNFIYQRVVDTQEVSIETIGGPEKDQKLVRVFWGPPAVTPTEVATATSCH